MNFELSAEQAMLKDAVERYMREDYGFERRQRNLQEPRGWSAQTWQQFAQLGLLGLSIDESHGGFAAGSVDTLNVMQALGGALCVEPYLATAVLCARAIGLAGTEAQKQIWLPRIAGGNLLMAFAHAERAARYDVSHVGASAMAVHRGFRLNGSKSLVLHGDSADQLLVTARIEGSARDRDGLALFVVGADAPGVVRRKYRTQDGRGAADVELQNVEVTDAAVLGTPGQAITVIEGVVEHGIAAIAAEAVGVMDQMMRLTLEHLRTRRQFGAAIGSFQALQHRAVDMAVAVEQARSMAIYGALMLDEPDPVLRARAVSAVKVQCGKSLRFVAQQSVQLHGAIGLTDEYQLGHYFLRATVIESQFGDTGHHLRQLAA